MHSQGLQSMHFAIILIKGLGLLLTRCVLVILCLYIYFEFFTPYFVTGESQSRGSCNWPKIWPSWFHFTCTSWSSLGTTSEVGHWVYWTVTTNQQQPTSSIPWSTPTGNDLPSTQPCGWYPKVVFWSKSHKEDDHVDPLAEWKGYSSWYSPLTSFVCLILSIPCTSAPSERTFSHSGYLASKARNRIGSDVLELFTVVKSYLQNYCGEEEVLLAEIMATLQQWTENGWKKDFFLQPLFIVKSCLIKNFLSLNGMFTSPFGTPHLVTPTSTWWLRPIWIFGVT